MLLEMTLFPILIGGVVLYKSQKGWTDQKKIEKILELAEIKEKHITHKFVLLRKDPINKDPKIGTEYVYKIPLQSSNDDIERIYPKIRDGINIKREGNQKHVEMEYDGALKITVYEKDIPKKVDYTKETIEMCRGWTVSLGENFKGTVLHDFDSIPHMLVAGTTRYGKTVFLKNVITTLTVNHPENVIFTLIDLKGMLAFARFENLRQVKYTACDGFEAKEVLTQVVLEMVERQRKWRGKFEDVGEARLKERHFVIVDEGAQLSSKQVKDPKLKKTLQECEKLIEEIAAIGGGLGYRLIFATQYPLRENLPPTVKQNSDAKVVFRLQNGKASETVMNEKGAEKLPRKKDDYKGGRAIYMTDAPMIVQTPFIENKLIDELLEVYQVVKDVENNYEDQRGENGENTIEFR